MARSRNNSSLDGSVVEVLGNGGVSPEASTGILSQTLSPSPTVRWILPARIRSQMRNDVVFVGETFVQLRELLDNGVLADVTAKFDLGAPILAAKVISARSEIVEFVDQVIEQKRDEVRWVLNGQVINDFQPPQILVVSLSSSDIVYLYAKQMGPGDVQFVHGRRKLLSGVSTPERYGRHMAVDPESRAMAVASSISHCAIFSLKQVDEIKEEIDNWDSSSTRMFRPTHEDRFIQIDGFILCMDFLPSSTHDPAKVLLLLLVANAGITSLLLYRWDSRHPLANARPLRCSGQRLPTEDAFPLMLIPSSKYTSFIIVTETALAIYENVLSSEAKRISFSLPKKTPANYENSSRPPLWVQWAKAPRHAEHRQSHDDFFLVREDGELRYYILNYKSALKVDAHFSPGNLGVNVDSAFCILGGPPEQGGDTFLVGGDMTDGGVYHCLPRGMPCLSQVLPNMAPTHDMLTVDALENANSRELLSLPRAERTFTCSGKGAGHCYVSELRFGIEAQLGWAIGNPESASTTRLWALEDPTTNRLLLIASHPVHSTVVIFPLTSFGEAEAGDAHSCPGIDFDSATLAMAAITTEAFVQITPHSINIVSFKPGFTPVKTILESQKILAADFDAKSALLVLALQDSEGFRLRVCKISRGVHGSLGVEIATAVHILEDEPVALCLTSLANASIVAVSTNTGLVSIFLTDFSRGLKPLYTNRFFDLIPATESASASSLQLLSDGISPRAVLLCGFRNGKLGCLGLRIENSSPPILRIQCDDSFDLGSTTVYVAGVASNRAETTALAYCRSELRRIALVPESPSLEYEITSIWLVDGGNSSRPQPTVNAACVIPSLTATDDGGLSGLLIWAAADELLVSSLVLQEQAVPRRFKVHGTPQKLAYSRRAQRLIVAGGFTSTSSERSGMTPSRMRTTQPCLQLVPPTKPSPLRENSSAEDLMVFGEPGERVRCLTLWTPSDGERHYDLVLVGLDADAADVNKRSGRVVAISVKHIGSEPKATSKLKTVARYPGQPVYALCALGKCSLLTAAGDDLIMQTLDVASRKWSLLTKFTLPSSALSLSTKGAYIFAATSRHSIIILKEQGNTIKFHSSDIRSRNATNVLTSFQSPTLITTTSIAGSSLLGFSEQLVRGKTNLLFEAIMPLTIERIRQSHEASNQQSRRYFHGSTLDGTFYRFMTLQHHEWQLLRFLESLSPLRSNKSEDSSDSGMSLDDDWEAISPRSATSGEEQSRTHPAQMHVRGDILASMIRPGPYSLRNLLLPEVKMEDDIDFESRRKARCLEFERLAVPVIGEMEDKIGGMTRWLRKLLRLPQ